MEKRGLVVLIAVVISLFVILQACGTLIQVSNELEAQNRADRQKDALQQQLLQDDSRRAGGQASSGSDSLPEEVQEGSEHRAVTAQDVPVGALAVFSTARTGSSTDSEAVLVEEVSPYGDYVGTAGKRIQWDTDYYAILGYVPQVGKNYLLHKITSASYASSSIYPVTKNEKLYVFRDWDSSSDYNIKDVAVYDPMTGALLQSISLFPPAAANPAIVGDTIYYTDKIHYASQGGYLGGGDLYVYRPGDASSAKLISGFDLGTIGTLYSVGTSLFSVTVKDGVITVREHDIDTGRVARELYSFPDPYPVYVTFAAGETALYLLQNTGNEVAVTAIYPGGTGSRELLQVELDGGETDLHIDEEDGKLVLAPVSSGAGGIGYDAVTVYDLQSGESGITDLGRHILLYSSGAYGDQFYFLKQPKKY